jgi:radical SAM superfamily enzyme YgiQ (UPF0313 family)
MKNVYLAQFSTVSLDTYYFFPYSVGLIRSYAQSIPLISKNYDLKPLLWKKLPIDDLVNSLDNPAVFGFSSYVWNANYNLQLAKAVKTRYPDCIIVFGGPGVPDADADFFTTHPWVDYLIHTEGEQSFANLLETLLKGPCKSHVSIPSNRTKSLNTIPSPYLSGVFDSVLAEAKDQKVIINALLETNRGCPFKCTFCDWGGLTFSKIHCFDLDRIKQEITWLGKNKIEMLSLADANFGIFPDRDLKIAQWAIKTKQEYGFPKYFDTSWTKNTKPETIETAKLLMQAGMLRKFVMSLQTLDLQTLSNIKRRNIDGSKFSQLIEDRSVSVSTELIVGLPGETLTSYKQGVCRLIDDNIKIITNPLTLLPNSEMSTPTYRSQWSIEYVTFKSSWSSHSIDEWEDLVVATSSYTTQDWGEMILWGWLTVFLETYYWTDLIAKQFDTQMWYDWCYGWFRTHDNPLTPWLSRWENHLSDGLSYELWGGGVGTTDLDANQAIIDSTSWNETLALCIKEFCETHSLPYPSFNIIYSQTNRHKVLEGYSSLSQQLVANRWNFLSKNNKPIEHLAY